MSVQETRTCLNDSMLEAFIIRLHECIAFLYPISDRPTKQRPWLGGLGPDKEVVTFSGRIINLFMCLREDALYLYLCIYYI